MRACRYSGWCTGLERWRTGIAGGDNLEVLLIMRAGHKPEAFRWVAR